MSLKGQTLFITGGSRGIGLAIAVRAAGAGARTWRAYLSTQGSALNDPKVDWTKSGAEGSAMTGHHDRSGPIDHPWATSWNSSHPTRGCTTKGIESTGGDGRFFCFAVK